MPMLTWLVLTMLTWLVLPMLTWLVSTPATLTGACMHLNCLSLEALRVGQQPPPTLTLEPPLHGNDVESQPVWRPLILEYKDKLLWIQQLRDSSAVPPPAALVAAVAAAAVAAAVVAAPVAAPVAVAVAVAVAIPIP